MGIWDVVIVGGGIIGSSCLRSISTSTRLSCLLLEKNPQLLSETSSSNSALLHTGFDASPSAVIERRLVKRGFQLFKELHKKLKVPFDEDAKGLLVAWTKEEMEELPRIVKRAHENGCTLVRQISREELYSMEPCLSKEALGAVIVPGEQAVNGWTLPIQYIRQSLLNGASVKTNCKTLHGHWDEESLLWHLTTSQGIIKCRMVINAAGCHGDSLESTLGRTPLWQIRPRKGQFLVLQGGEGEGERETFSSLILPVPSEKTKGILIWRDVNKNIVVGPTAEDQEEKDLATLSEATLLHLHSHASKYVPSLAKLSRKGAYAGLRPAIPMRKDYLIRLTKGLLTVAGIRSTGLTASLAIGEYASQMVVEHFERQAKGETRSCAMRKDPEKIIWPDAIPQGRLYGLTFHGREWANTHKLNRINASL